MNSPRVWGTLLALVFGAGVSCSRNANSAPQSGATALTFQVVTNVPAPQPGVFEIPRLSVDAARQQSNGLVRLRHLPKAASLQGRTFTERSAPRHSIRYLLFKPATTNAQPLPLVLSLHGGGPRHRFEDLLEPYAPGFAYGLGRLVAPESQQEHPSFVVAPWSDRRAWDEDNIRLVLGLLDALAAEFNIDSTRIYVTGQSMGGGGTWSIITAAPERFAAAIPICGTGDDLDAPRLRALPLWAFHGSIDSNVPPHHTRQRIQALQQAGGQPIYWEYKDAGHAGTAERAYGEPELLAWLFAQRRR